MQRQDPTDIYSDREYLYEFASALVAGLGYHGAVDECLRNGWDGALGALLNRKPGVAAVSAPAAQVERGGP